MSSPIRFSTKHHANFYEIDSYGHLNTVHYVSYFLAHRSTAMRERFGLGMSEVDALPVAFYMKHIEISFMRPVIGDSALTIESYIAEKEESTCKVICNMTDSNNKLMSRATMSLVCVDKTSLKPTTWPEDVMARFYS